MPNLDQTLAKMAEQLGTKAETLWPQLVATQRMEWWAFFIAALLLALVALLVYRFAEEWGDGRDAISFFAGTVALGLLVLSLCRAPSMLVYPEVGAAKSLLTGRK